MDDFTKAEMFMMIMSTVKETCTPDEKGEYKVTELISQALSLRNHMETTTVGYIREESLEGIDAYLAILMLAFLQIKSKGPAKEVVTAPSQPKSIELKPHRKVKKEEKRKKLMTTIKSEKEKKVLKESKKQ